MWNLGLHSKEGTRNAGIWKQSSQENTSSKRASVLIHIVSGDDFIRVFAATLINFHIE
jgi:hypothetical protein